MLSLILYCHRRFPPPNRPAKTPISRPSARLLQRPIYRPFPPAPKPKGFTEDRVRARRLHRGPLVVGGYVDAHAANDRGEGLGGLGGLAPGEFGCPRSRGAREDRGVWEAQEELPSRSGTPSEGALLESSLVRLRHADALSGMPLGGEAPGAGGVVAACSLRPHVGNAAGRVSQEIRRRGRGTCSLLVRPRWRPTRAGQPAVQGGRLAEAVDPVGGPWGCDAHCRHRQSLGEVARRLCVHIPCLHRSYQGHGGSARKKKRI